MTFVLHILLAYFAPIVRDLGVEPWTVRAPWVLALLPVAHTLSFASRAAGARGRFHLAGILDFATRVSAPLLQTVAVLCLGWYDAVLAWTEGAELSSADSGLVLALTLLPYAVFELLAIDAHSRSIARGRLQIERHRSLQVRLFASIALPLGAFLGVATAAGANETVRVHLEEVQLLHAVWTIVLFTGFAWVLPRFLRHTWGTAPVPAGWVRSILEETAHRAGFRCREYVVWHTSHQMANAAIVGVTPGSRIVFFTDALLARLGPRELAAVFAHEIGHARHHHALVFVSYALFLLLGTGLVAGAIDFESTGAEAAFFGGTIVFWYLSFGYVSRRFELDADLNSVEVVGDTEPLITALEAVSGAHARSRGSWRHFSTADRVRFLERTRSDPRLGRRLRSRLRVFSLGAFVSFLAVLALTLFRWADELPTDRFYADVRLGLYESALTRLDDGADVEPELVELIGRATVIPHEERSAEALDQRAIEEFDAYDVSTARDLVELALLRGKNDLVEVLVELNDRMEGRTGAPEEGRGIPERWREELWILDHF